MEMHFVNINLHIPRVIFLTVNNQIISNRYGDQELRALDYDVLYKIHSMLIILKY